MATQQVHSLVHKMVLDNQAYIKGTKQTRSEQQLLKGVIESMKTPLQKYEDGLEVLNKQLKAGKLTQEQYSFAAKKLKGDLDNQTKATKKAGEQQKKTFGAGAISGIQNYATSIVSVGTAVGLVTNALRLMNQEAEAGKESFRGLAEERRRLAQVGQTTARSDRAAARFGVERDVAARVFFSAQSEGFTQDFERILGANLAVNPEAAAGVAGQIPELFGGKISPIQSVNAVLAAARESRLDFKGIAQAAPSAAVGGRGAGASPEETFAALAVLAGQNKSGDVAGNLLKAFGSKVNIQGSQFGVGGGGFLQSVQQIQNLSPEDRKKFLGESIEINQAFNQLSSNFEKVAKQAKTVNQAVAGAGTNDSLLQSVVRSQLNNGLIQQQVNADRARISREIANEPNAGVGFEREAALNKARAAALGGSTNVFGRSLAETQAGLNYFAGASSNEISSQYLDSANFFSGNLGFTGTDLQRADLQTRFDASGGIVEELRKLNEETKAGTLELKAINSEKPPLVTTLD